MLAHCRNSRMGPDGQQHNIQEEIENSEDPIETRKEKIEEYRNKFANPYVAASRGYIDDVIEPEATRPRLISALEILESKRENRPPRNMVFPV